MNLSKRMRPLLGIIVVLALLTACSARAAESGIAGLSKAEVATLSSLKRVDDYPLYTMQSYGGYERAAVPAWIAQWPVDVDPQPSPSTWSCSLFAAFADADDALYGRNFDWQYSPALLLFTDPPDGYASVAMVDIAYLGFDGPEARKVTDLPLSERRALLEAPFLPFDGMNEHGLAVGMAAVPQSPMPHDARKPTIGSLGVIREILDHARDVNEALDILGSYNVSWTGGPPLHYLIADMSGRAVLVEYYQGEQVITPNTAPWHQATNFIRAAAGETALGQCWRYDRIHQRLSRDRGRVKVDQAMDLLAAVAQDSTQWSIVYGMGSGDINVVMGRKYDAVQTFHMRLAGE